MRVLCFGNSLTAGSPGYDPAFGGNRQFQYAFWMVEAAKREGYDSILFQNHGVPGDLASLMERRLEHALNTSSYDISVILAGTNDLGTGSSVQSVLESLKTLWHISIDFGVPVISSTIPPIGSVYPPLQKAQKSLNSLILSYSNEAKSILCVDVFGHLSTPEGLLFSRYDSGDGLHLSIDGYRKLGEAIWEDGIRQILLRGLDSLL